MTKIMENKKTGFLQFVKIIETYNKSVERPKKTPTFVNQKDLIYNMLLNGNEFTELELTKAITNNNERGARSFISILRREGYPIASKNVINRYTGRLNKAYYWENDKAKYIQWCLNNGYFEFKKGAPK
jgi:hypothetical protein